MTDTRDDFLSTARWAAGLLREPAVAAAWSGPSACRSSPSAVSPVTSPSRSWPCRPPWPSRFPGNGPSRCSITTAGWSGPWPLLLDDLLSRLAVRRHGPTAVLRALSRAERAPATIAAI
jgi:hypothetical protein